MSAILHKSVPESHLVRGPSLAKKVWTVPQFHFLGDLGMFEGARAMLIDGAIIEEGPMNPPHRKSLELTIDSIRTAFGPHKRICSQMPLVLGLTTDPEPDVAVVPGTIRGSNDHPTSAELVIEISDTSLSFDTNEKMSLYATAGIADYWVVDVNARKLLVFRNPIPDTSAIHGATYSSKTVLSESDSVSSLAMPTAKINISDLLP